MTQFKCTRLVGALAAVWGFHGAAFAQIVVEDTLTGASSTFQWQALNGACLTAGNGTGTIPACVGLSYYSGKTLVGGSNLTGANKGRLPDVVGKGALRLTNGDTQDGGGNGDNQTGAVVSNFTFPTNQGLEVTFTTVTYGGDNLDGHGADGISFYLMDGSRSPSVGGLGGSLGYSCSNVNAVYDGVAGAYLGVGIDEFGNFSNSGDNTDTGPGKVAGRISVRGAGDTNWASLNSRFPLFYPAGLSAADKELAVKNTCRTGRLWNYNTTNQTDANNSSIAPRTQSTQRLSFNYPLISYSDLPSSVSIANQQGTSQPLRPSAIPITYALKITQNGLLNFSYSVNGGTSQTVISNQQITASNGPLPASFRFGFSSGTGGGNNVHEITCFKAAPVEESNSSAGTNTQPSSRVQSGSQLFLAYFHPTNWWGQLTAQSLVTNADDTLSLSSTINWDAHCTLTGTCGSGSTITPTNRRMLTWDPVAQTGIPFQWASLSAAQKSVLTAGETSDDTRLLYLRGSRSAEIANGGTLRTRTSVLGDITDSSPTWVGYPTLPYTGTWADGINSSATPPENSGTSYTSFKSTNATRQNLVYVGSNDGFLHAFRAGSFDASGNFTSDGTNDGLEALAYMPSTVLSTIHSTTGTLDFSNPQYSHNFFVNATPGTGDLYYSNSWHTWLVGGLGAGGNATGPVANTTGTAKGTLFALDVTDPTRFSEANASSLVLGEWDSTNITCTNDTNCKNKLGSVSGTPIVRRLHNGLWAVIFGNGLNSSTGNAGVFIMLVSSTGARSFLYLDTGAAASTNPKNGIVNVSSADFDGDHITDYLYAGDALGNVWRFDLTGSATSTWTSATPYKLFSGSSSQPITTSVTVASTANTAAGGRRRVMVSFGTGQMFPQTASSAASFASGTQYLYGIWDANMTSWNTKASVESAKREAIASAPTVTSSNLLDQTVTSTLAGSGAASALRVVSANTLCFQGSTICGSGNDKYGWRLALPSASEQVIFNPTVVFDNFVVNTTIPGVNQALTCDSQPATGFTMAVSVADGGAPKSPFFVTGSNNASNAIIAGLGLGGTGTPTLGRTKGKFFLLQQTKTPGTNTSSNVQQVNPSVSHKGGRLNWKKVR